MPKLWFHAPNDLIDGLEYVSLVDFIDDLVVIVNMKVKPIIIECSMGGLLTLKLIERGFGKM